MKKINYLLPMLALAGFSTSLNAAHWRVSNITDASAQYTSVQTAHDATSVLPGDTLYIEPSGVSYGNLNWSKRLTIIGNGYLLAANPETQANTANSKLGSVTISNGANTSMITGSEINTLTFTNSASNIFIRRNLITSITSDQNPGANIYIIQNYISNINFSASFSNVSVENNIFIGSINFSSSMTTGIFQNNVMLSNFDATNCTLRNNISLSNNISYFKMINCRVYNNIGISTQFGTENGNMSNVNMANVFVCWPTCPNYSADGCYQLKTGSIAAGAGYDGIDCGIFAGNYPYVLSGIPTVPAIYYLFVQPQGDLLNVNVKIKSHD